MNPIEEILSLYLKCSLENWNSYGDKPVSFNVVSNALSFNAAIPVDLENFETCVEPGGAISFDWIKGKSKNFSVSVSEHFSVCFAFKDDLKSGICIVDFENKEELEKLFSDIRDFLKP